VAGAEPAASVVALRTRVAGEDELLRLRRAIDLPRLIEAGYDPDAHVVRLVSDHPALGYALCPVSGCIDAVEHAGLCNACRHRFERFDGTLDEFVTIPRTFVRRGKQSLCTVGCTPGHERPAIRSGLCMCCDKVRGARQSSSTSLPRSPAGRLGAARWADYGRVLLYRTCYREWYRHGKPDVAEFATSPLFGARAASRTVDVRRSPNGRGLRFCTDCRRSGWKAGIRGEAPAGCRA